MAGIHGFFWPKIFWDFLTKNLDGAVKPIPVLQTLNVVFGLIMVAWEWPLPLLAGSAMHRSIELRLVLIPIGALAAALLYQGTNAALYYVVGMIVYFWAYSEGEVSFSPSVLYLIHKIKKILTINLQVIVAKPWSLPQRSRPGKV